MALVAACALVLPALVPRPAGPPPPPAGFRFWKAPRAVPAPAVRPAQTADPDDRFLRVVPDGLDDPMIAEAPSGIDEGMIVNAYTRPARGGGLLR